MAYRIQIRRDIVSAWTTADPVLASGEFGLETDTGKLKLGDGATAWTSLPYLFAGDISSAIRQVFTTDGYYDIPQYYLLEKLVVQPASDIDLKLGSTNGGEEYLPETTVTGTDGECLVINLFANSTKRVYISGITSSTAIVFYLRYVNQS